jgi:hypothetical protein
MVENNIMRTEQNSHAAEGTLQQSTKMWFATLVRRIHKRGANHRL